MEVYLADIVARAYGITDPKTDRGQFVALYEALMGAQDAVAKVRDLPEITEMKAARKNILRLLEAGESIVDVPAIIDMEFMNVVRCVTLGQASVLWLWDELDWVGAEVLLHAADIHSPSKLARNLGINVGAAISLIKVYSKQQSTRANRLGTFESVA